MRIIGIDPGPVQSGVVILEPEQQRWADVIHWAGVVTNGEAREMLRAGVSGCVGIEQIRSYGMAVGASVFDTCVETGRFVECCHRSDLSVTLIPRADIKLHLCLSPRAKDPNIRQALIDRYGPPGTKASPGGTYGVKTHAWAALAVATTLLDRLELRNAA